VLPKTVTEAGGCQGWYWAVDEAETAEQLGEIGDTMSEQVESLPSGRAYSEVDTGDGLGGITHDEDDEDSAKLQDLERTFSRTTQGTQGSKSSNGLTGLVKRLTSRAKTG
jgi:hypothetical protein